MKVLYHGSPVLFNKFDYRKIGSSRGTEEGFGFYLTDSLDFAKTYAVDLFTGQTGYLYKCIFKGKKSASLKRKSITKQQLTTLVRRLDSLEGFLSCYGDVGFEGYNTVLRRAVTSLWENSESDVEIFGDMINSFGGSEFILRTVYDVLGIDHTKTKEVRVGGHYIYVVYIPELIEIVDVVRVN